MSGPFSTTGKYETDNADVVNIRVQPETEGLNIGAANAAPAGSVDPAFPSAIVGGSRKKIGIHARHVTIKLTAAIANGPANGSILRVPILKKSVFDGMAKKDTGTYQGAACIVVSKTSEDIV